MKLKVFVGNIYLYKVGQVEAIVAAKSINSAAKLIGTSSYQIKEYFSVTGNKEQIKIATSAPGKIFVRNAGKHGNEFVQMDKI